MSKLGILYFAGAFLFGVSGALAQTANSNNNASSGSQSGATAIAIGSSNTSPNKIKTTVPAFAPGLVAAGVHSCAGSTSVGVGATGWGFGFGNTYEMRECNRRAYAAALLGMGHRAAALDLICLNGEVRSALNATGVVCPSQGVAYRSAPQRPVKQTLFASAPAAAPAAIPVSAPRMAQAQASGRRTYSAKALGLSASDLRAKGCVLRASASGGRAWHCSQPVM